MKGFIKEFKDFAIKGNMIDMAVGIIIGTAFNNVVNTLVKKVVMPPLSLLTDDVNLAERKYILREAEGEASEVAIGYGELIEVLIDFTIIALTIFVVIKFMNRFKKKAEDPKNKAVETPKNIELLANIENLMKEQNTLLKNKHLK
ncbi:MAG TPA: large-conductance mechanosensitive channel protein MscL [Flavobacteriaceae bacterium]|jgi:large conductance mechanosensitive channel|nr:large conductance mechanosensitive channel protein MscL [Flavobacteriaceae bacterium]MAM27481.1 large conductance mechanosensitive channel protein MscL [Flavobacteriaceae bacterium]MAY52180.1 large conductance mechanosensitive channel protein MscL [Flavobacteriaceae bacterium]HBR52871.1 large conductance mechanosensitive channel protein MscL [Flavobacteriaceae bacterium]HIB48027.1 large-conductance mechanosensitive channel protein MscL [Flavobacteriaceae bacterium]|tara:strand:- start:117 stop:551 length:435 start_codon:yes stop_codon:yes gene_type:complete